MRIVENKIKLGRFEGRRAYVYILQWYDEEEVIREMLNAGPIRWENNNGNYIQ